MCTTTSLHFHALYYRYYDMHILYIIIISNYVDHMPKEKNYVDQTPHTQNVPYLIFRPDKHIYTQSLQIM